MSVVREFVDGPYGQMHLRKTNAWSSGHRPLLCLHMFPQSSVKFRRLLEVVDDDRLVVAPDFPGYGESDHPQQPIAAEDYAASIWRVVDALSLLDPHGQIDVFGIHAGAKLAVEFLSQRPEHVNRVVLSSAAVLYPNEIDELRASFQPIQLDEAGTRFTHLWNLLMRNRHDDMTLERCASVFAEMLRGGEQYEWGHHAVFEYNLKFPSVLESVTHPVALLNPKDELYQMTKRTMTYLPNAQLFDLPEWGHGYLDAHAERAYALVRDWISPDISFERTEPTVASATN